MPRRPLPLPLSLQREVREEDADKSFAQNDLQFFQNRFEGDPSSVALDTRISIAVSVDARILIPLSRFQRERSFCLSPAAGEGGAARFSLLQFARSMPHQVRAARAARAAVELHASAASAESSIPLPLGRGWPRLLSRSGEGPYPARSARDYGILFFRLNSLFRFPFPKGKGLGVRSPEASWAC